MKNIYVHMRQVNDLNIQKLAFYYQMGCILQAWTNKCELMFLNKWSSQNSVRYSPNYSSYLLLRPIVIRVVPSSRHCSVHVRIRGIQSEDNASSAASCAPARICVSFSLFLWKVTATRTCYAHMKCDGVFLREEKKIKDRCKSRRWLNHFA